MELEQPETYLQERSGLPGPRANLTLVAEAGDVLRRLAASDDEFLALCGTAGLGRLLAEGDRTVLPVLRARAQDERWRVREGVAMALRDPGIAARVVALVDTVMRAFVASAGRDRVLRKALGYCWSVAVAAAPGPGLAAFDAWAGVEDRDVAWIVRENECKARMKALRR